MNFPTGLVSDTSLSDWLRRRTDDELAELLRRRPDLALPAPADFATLANRLGVRASVQRAIDGLDAVRLATLEALVLTGAVADAAGPYPAGLGRPADRLLAAVSDVTLAPVLRALGLPPAGQPSSGAA